MLTGTGPDVTTSNLLARPGGHAVAISSQLRVFDTYFARLREFDWPIRLSHRMYPWLRRVGERRVRFIRRNRHYHLADSVASHSRI